jgi:hypothetical protein
VTHFTTLGFIDPFDLLCSMKGRLGEFQGAGLRILHLRAARKSAPEEFLDTREATRWPEYRAILERVAAEARSKFGAEIEFARCWLEMLDAGTGVRPRVDRSAYALGHMRLVYGLRCNPSSYLWCPPEQRVLNAGEILLTAPALWHGAVNMGEFSRIHLVMDIAIAQKETFDGPLDAMALVREEELA